MNFVNELTTAYLQVVFKDRDGAPAVPGTVTYTVHDRDSGDQLAAGTPNAAATVLFTMGTAVNGMVDSERSREERVLTYTGDYGAGDQYNGRYIYAIVNLAYKG